MDLKQESYRKFRATDLGGAKGRSAWQYQFALHLGPRMRAFYDTDNDGQIDLIQIGIDDDGVQDVFRLDKGKWIQERGTGGKMIDPEKIPDKVMRERFDRIVRNLLD
jgi:hypothetical protein